MEPAITITNLFNDSDDNTTTDEDDDSSDSTNSGSYSEDQYDLDHGALMMPPLGTSDGYNYLRHYHELHYGGFSSIFLARKSTDNRPLAAKLIYLNSNGINNPADFRDKIIAKLEKARKLSKELKRRCIVKLIEVSSQQRPDGIIVYTHLYHGGNLLQWMIGQQVLTLGSIGQLLTRLFQALYYLHSHSQVHGNLQPTSILFRSPTLSGADSLALMPDISIKPVRSSCDQLELAMFNVMSPETIEQLIDGQVNWQPTRSSDLWAAGIIAHIALTGRPPKFVTHAPCLSERLEWIRMFSDADNDVQHIDPVLIQTGPTFTYAVVELLACDSDLERRHRRRQLQADKMSSPSWFNLDENDDGYTDLALLELNLMSMIEYNLIKTEQSYHHQGPQLLSQMIKDREEEERNKSTE